MSIDIKCDKCKKPFEYEVYCADCISELETENHDLKTEIDYLNKQIKELEEKV